MMDFDTLAKLAGAAVSIVQHGTELVAAVTENVQRSKAALPTHELETLTLMLEQSHQRSQARGAELDAKLNRLING